MWDFFSLSKTYVEYTNEDVRHRRAFLAEYLNDQCIPRESAIDIQGPLQRDFGKPIGINTIRTEIRAFQIACEYLTGGHTGFINDQLKQDTWVSRPLACLLRDGFDTWAKVEAARKAETAGKTKKEENASKPTSPIPAPAEGREPEAVVPSSIPDDIINTEQLIAQPASPVVLVDAATWERLGTSFRWFLTAYCSTQDLRGELKNITAARDALQDRANGLQSENRQLRAAIKDLRGQVDRLEAASATQSNLQIIDESTLPGAMTEALRLTEETDTQRGA